MSDGVLSVVFERSTDLLAQEPHIAHGGLFVPTPEPPPAPLATLVVLVVGSYGATVDLPARVVQIAPSGGMALAFADAAAARAALKPLLEAAHRGAGAAAGDGPVRAAWGRYEPPAARSPERSGERSGVARGSDEGDEPQGTLYERVRNMSKAERRQLALRGDRAARLVLIKSADKDIHRFVIQNPALTLDEVQYIASYRQTNPEVLKRIAANREWLQNPRVVSNLVCNPKTPTPLALRLMTRLPIQELSRLARSDSTPPAVQAAARRKIVGA